jgi:mono/diheme cytochrome c family protein
MLTLLLTAMLAQAADSGAGAALMKKECVGCHGLRIITIQRLARPTWEKELDKMAGWGAKTSDRKTLVDYLVSEYGNDKPIPAPPLTVDGKK